MTQLQVEGSKWAESDIGGRSQPERGNESRLPGRLSLGPGLGLQPGDTQADPDP